MERHKKPSTTVKAKRNKLLDIAIGLVLVIICLVLAKSLLDQVGLKHEVKEATAASNQVIEAIRHKDGKAARNLSFKTFKAENTAENLTAQFTSISKFTAATPAVSHTTVSNDDGGQAVSVIYKFPSKPVIYARILVIKPNDAKSFQMAKLNVDTSEQKLLDISR